LRQALITQSAHNVQLVISQAALNRHRTRLFLKTAKHHFNVFAAPFLWKWESKEAQKSAFAPSAEDS
jgi:hypothetical protein